MSDNVVADMQVYQAQADSVQEEMDRFQWLKSQARIVPSIDGEVLSQDPVAIADAFVPRGQMLFVVGSTQQLCARAVISQDDVVEFKMALDLAKAGPGELRGELILKGHPNKQVSVLFESLDLSAVASGKLVAVPPGVAPGMRISTAWRWWATV